MLEHAIVNQPGRLMVNNWIVSALFPPNCLLCGSATGPMPGRRDLCAGCAGDLVRIAHGCHRCGIPLPERAAPSILCGRCQRQQPPFDRCLVPYVYEPNISILLTRLKFGRTLSCARLLGELLADYLTGCAEEPPGLVMPVPLHPRRVRERGFNQALEIARVAAQRTGARLDRNSLVRRRETPPQTGLSRKQRLNNLRNAFELRRPLVAEHVAVVDDVVTTGSTVAEISRLLKRSGVGKVSVWAVARTPE